MKKLRMIVGIACGVTFSFMSFAAPPEDQRVSTNPTPEEVRKAMDRIPPITVYGRVLDQNENPVPEAEIEMSWHTVRLGLGWGEDVVKSEWVKTDKEGFFRWSVIMGFSPGVSKLRKSGYEYIPSMSSYFDPMTGGDLMISSTSRQKPLLLYLRKKGETAFLLKREMLRLDIKLGGEVARVADLLPPPDQYELDMRAAGKMQGNQQIGFGAKAEYSTNEPTYRITFIAPEGGGILATDTILYEAPTGGYQAETTVTFQSERHGKQTFFREKPTWLFIKMTDPELYIRLKLDVKLAWGNPVVYFESAINPYGERNLEEETGLDYDGRKQLEADARIKLRQSKRPAKPDLTKLLKEAKARAEKDRDKP